MEWSSEVGYVMVDINAINCEYFFHQRDSIGNYSCAEGYVAILDLRKVRERNIAFQHKSRSCTVRYREIPRNYLTAFLNHLLPPNLAFSSLQSAQAHSSCNGSKTLVLWSSIFHDSSKKVLGKQWC